MNVLVTGGTGFVGREVVRELRERGHEVRLLVRNRHSAVARALEQRFAAQLSEGDVLNGNSLHKILHGCDAVIHLVGIISEFGVQTFENVHTRGTENILRAAIVAGARRFVHMSALGTRSNARSRYHQSKWAAEVAVTRSTLDWTIFRPSIIYGPEDHFINLFARLTKSSPVLPVMGDGKALLQPVAVEEVARCFVGALCEPRAIRETFDVCGPDRLTMPQILRLIAKILDRKRLIVHVPSGLAAFAGGIAEYVFPKFLKKPPPLNRDQLLMLQEDNIGDASWATELFRLEHKNFVDGISRYLKPELV